jgi:hypothetical protein
MIAIAQKDHQKDPPNQTNLGAFTVVLLRSNLRSVSVVLSEQVWVLLPRKSPFEKEQICFVWWSFWRSIWSIATDSATLVRVTVFAATTRSVPGNRSRTQPRSLVLSPDQQVKGPAKGPRKDPQRATVDTPFVPFTGTFLATRLLEKDHRKGLQKDRREHP